MTIPIQKNPMPNFWNGNLVLRLPDTVQTGDVTATLKLVSEEQDESAAQSDQGGDVQAWLKLLSEAVSLGFWGAAQMDIQETLTDGWRLKVKNLPSVVWLVWSNLLYARDRMVGRSFRIQNSEQEFSLEIKGRAYINPIPVPVMPVDFSRMMEIMIDEFLIRFHFFKRLDGDERDRFCHQLDLWIALLDGGAFPMQDTPDEPSVFGGDLSRFEDYETALIEVVGMVAGRDGLGPLIALCNQWHSVHPLKAVEVLTHSGS